MWERLRGHKGRAILSRHKRWASIEKLAYIIKNYSKSQSLCNIGILGVTCRWYRSTTYAFLGCNFHEEISKLFARHDYSLWWRKNIKENNTAECSLVNAQRKRHAVCMYEWRVYKHGTIFNTISTRLEEQFPYIMKFCFQKPIIEQCIKFGWHLLLIAFKMSCLAPYMRNLMYSLLNRLRLKESFY